MIFCSSDRDAPLHLAASNGRVEACSLLIASKADVDAQNRCALFLKCVSVSVFELYCVFENCIMIFCSSVGCQDTALHGAAWSGYTAVCQTPILTLIEGEANVNVRERCVFLFKICY